MCRSRIQIRIIQVLAIISVLIWFIAIYLQSTQQIDTIAPFNLDVIREGFSIRIGPNHRNSIQDVFKKGYHRSAKIRKPYIPPLPKNYDPNGLGENGSAVIVPDQFKNQSEALFKRNMFNQWASDRISLHRTLPEARHPLCRNQTFPKDLPSTSVVIAFHNEAWSTLLRTVHSILDRSSPDLLHEIILQDDFSDVMTHAELQAPLEQYISKLKKVKVFRNQKHEGLIRTRLNGFSHTTAPIVTFLDAHCEVNVGWLEPLLERIHDNPTTVVVPEIDIINYKTFEYTHYVAGNVRGIFNWRLYFRWGIVPPNEQKRRKSPIDPVWSPAMAGGLFSISRQNFVRLGTYDEEFDVWGGENIELSLKTWLCGGKLELVPCSRIGHVYRTNQPYHFSGNFLSRNSQRVAEVWMDEYKEFFYQELPSLRNQDYGNVSSRIQLRKRLKCKDFKWYLNNIFTDAVLPNESAIARGKIRNPESNLCFSNKGVAKNVNLALVPCTNAKDWTTNFAYTILEEVAVEEACLDSCVFKEGEPIQILDCHRIRGNQMWLHKQNGEIRHFVNGLCIDRGSGNTPVMMKCTGKASQIWTFDKYLTHIVPVRFRTTTPST